ncbi:hypothetical protein CI105_06620 [Candidatus Izimaplasma bacterium ZiA1]|uniref:type III pantothenate kinase n=1 Tax=Candidatus Izimoplasma sp. ZiA1 TaxID=2024899 RepID=UPI000BAA5D56|nr:hypothetical protein CI105_06620 [Candidatus Izimaplasma bacterium ZiA1]
MIILIDIGNTNIVIGEYKDEITKTYRFLTDKLKSADEYYIYLKDILKDAKGIIISSVVPELNNVFKELSNKYLSLDPIVVGPGVKTGLKIVTDNPKEVGADLVAGSVGAIKEYSNTCIVIDMGTATTFTLVKDSEIKGVVIAAGLITQKNALIGGASQLTQIEFKAPKRIVGTNTIDSLNSGLLYGHAYMMEGIINKMKEENNLSNCKVVITGGASLLVKELLNKEYIIDEFLLLKGLVHLYNKNIK